MSYRRSFTCFTTRSGDADAHRVKGSRHPIFNLVQFVHARIGEVAAERSSQNRCPGSSSPHTGKGVGQFDREHNRIAAMYLISLLAIMVSSIESCLYFDLFLDWVWNIYYFPHPLPEALALPTMNSKFHIFINGRTAVVNNPVLLSRMISDLTTTLCFTRWLLCLSLPSLLRDL